MVPIVLANLILGRVFSIRMFVIIDWSRNIVHISYYLEKIPKSTLPIPKISTFKEYLPESAPLLDFLVAESRAPEYPCQEELKNYREQRGLSYDMLDSIEVREIVTGVSSKEEILEIHDWVTSNYLKDQEKFGSKVVSIDVKDITASYYNLMRMSGRLPIIKNQIISTVLDKNIISGLKEDHWKQTPGKIMISNRISWTLIISINYVRNEWRQYYVRRMEVQPEIRKLI